LPIIIIYYTSQKLQEIYTKLLRLKYYFKLINSTGKLGFGIFKDFLSIMPECIKTNSILNYIVNFSDIFKILQIVKVFD
jgi:hypothetical protein